MTETFTRPSSIESLLLTLPLSRTRQRDDTAEASAAMIIAEEFGGNCWLGAFVGFAVRTAYSERNISIRSF
jgi:hypothetical protein